MALGMCFISPFVKFELELSVISDAHKNRLLQERERAGIVVGIAILDDSPEAHLSEIFLIHGVVPGAGLHI
jgi:hypothetical protein